MENVAMERFRPGICIRLWVIFLAGLAGGCGQDESDPPSATAEAKPAEPMESPEQTVHKFMMAFKNGDDEAAAKLLTDKARQEAERTQKAVSPPGSKTMQFKVGLVEYVTETKDGAHVACQIADVDPEGVSTNYDVIWFLRKETAGWRVAGVAMKVFEDQPPVLYNFEDQDDMDRKMQLIGEEMARREQAAVEEAKQTLLQAQQPSDKNARKQ
jgi:hypothetical protein